MENFWSNLVHHWVGIPRGTEGTDDREGFGDMTPAGVSGPYCGRLLTQAQFLLRLVDSNGGT